MAQTGISSLMAPMAGAGLGSHQVSAIFLCLKLHKYHLPRLARCCVYPRCCRHIGQAEEAEGDTRAARTQPFPCPHAAPLALIPLFLPPHPGQVCSINSRFAKVHILYVGSTPLKSAFRGTIR